MNFWITNVQVNNIPSIVRNWADTVNVPNAIDSVTYDLYETNNPFRKKYTKDEISGREARFLANTGTTIGAEVFSAFANPYYLTHKITGIPAMYHSVAEAYRKNASS